MECRTADCRVFGVFAAVLDSMILLPVFASSGGENAELRKKWIRLNEAETRKPHKRITLDIDVERGP